MERQHQFAAVDGQAADVVRRHASYRLDDAASGIDECQSAAECVGDKQLAFVVQEKLLARRERQVDDLADRWLLRQLLWEIDNRQTPGPEGSDEGAGAVRGRLYADRGGTDADPPKHFQLGPGTAEPDKLV